MAAAARVGTLMLSRGLTLATAESCTGGLVGHLVTQIPGSSEYYSGGVVAYGNDVKERLLGVPSELLRRHGAVSAEVAIAMAEGARARLDTSLSISTTGVAGPDGGSKDKPVGLVYIGLAAAGREIVTQRHLWPHDRDGNKRAAAGAALRLLESVLSDETGTD